MKKIIGMAALSVLVVSQLSFSAGKSNTDAAVQRLLKVAKQRQAEQAVEVTPVEVTGTTTTGTAPRVKRVNSKKAEIKAMKAKEKNMTESEKMDVEIQRIKNLGKKSLEEIKSVMEEIGYPVGKDIGDKEVLKKKIAELKNEKIEG